jgi:hypothetical protein
VCHRLRMDAKAKRIFPNCQEKAPFFYTVRSDYTDRTILDQHCAQASHLYVTGSIESVLHLTLVKLPGNTYALTKIRVEKTVPTVHVGYTHYYKWQL